MPYRFAIEHQDYSDLAAGKVLLSLPNHPPFPIRLASEIFQRCLDARARDGFTDRVRLYDPCCGGAYLLGTLAYLHWTRITHLWGSDIDSHAITLAARNLSLLTLEGFDQRISDLEALLKQFGKDSHAEALKSAYRLKAGLIRRQESHLMGTTLFQADALNPMEIAQKMNGHKVDLVITDVPYGRLSGWQTTGDALEAPNPAIPQLLESLQPILQPQSIVAICADKQQKVVHPEFRRVDHFQIGKRRIVLLRPLL
ncbi:MAG: hypothetical protein IAE83_05880 [Anaerolinea sp.]|nr:hypothetical protein [Anaerolinea sp.]CAG1001929.1 23S rRNA (guanine(2535)-N(1))-methyltransferase [Anaerolineae bacterium]